MEPKIIHKDRQLLIADKPAGMPSVNVPGGDKKTLANWIVQNFPKQKKVSADVGIINRLDNDTSGITVIARSDRAYESLREIWNSKSVHKTYLCLVLGQTPSNGKITKLIAHHPGKSNKMLVVENPDDGKKLKARYSETEYELLEVFFDYSLLKVRIVTGVRHQIRCHLASIGNPVAGDKLYQRTKHATRDWLKLNRHFLHAHKVRFTHPTSGTEVEFESELPDDLQGALNKLRAT